MKIRRYQVIIKDVPNNLTDEEVRAIIEIDLNMEGFMGVEVTLIAESLIQLIKLIDTGDEED